MADCQAILIKLLILCVKHRITVALEEMPTKHLKSFLTSSGSGLDLSEIPELYLTRPLFPIKFKAHFTLIRENYEVLINLHRLQLFNIVHLDS